MILLFYHATNTDISPLMQIEERYVMVFTYQVRHQEIVRLPAPRTVVCHPRLYHRLPRSYLRSAR